MSHKLKLMVIIEALIIAILVSAIIYSYSHNRLEKQQNYKGLLSPRVYAGLIEPKSFLIINFAPLKDSIQSFLAKNNYNASIYVENLRDGAFMGIDEKIGFFPASLNKLPVAILIMKKIEYGELSFDTMLEIKDSDRLNTSGTLYKIKDKKVPLRLVMEKLLQESDNTALSVLLHYANTNDLQLLLDYYGIDIVITNQSGRGRNNLVTPKSMSNLFRSLYFSTVLETKDSEYLLSLLKDTVFDIHKIANLPDNVIIIHKYGENYHNDAKYFHDCGIMYINESRILYCIMTAGLNEKEAVETMGVTVNEIYRYVQETKARLEVYKEKK